MNNNGSKPVIVSGMRPTGKLHIGHYIGVIENWVNLQKEFDCNFFVADWHALTTKYDDTNELRNNVVDVAIDWLACGINPETSTIYVQSHVPQIAELNVYLSMITPQNWVERDPTLKDLAKVLRSEEGGNAQISYGLMGYPVLMSSDIMMFNANCVPVGIDQVAHVEITRDIARRFNNLYKTDFFNEPIPKLTKTPVLYGLDGQKMGKSYNNDIKISDDEETTTKKLMTAITDPARIKKDDPGHPEDCQVAYKYWEIFGEVETVKTVGQECTQGARGCVMCKRQLAEVVNKKFAPIREKRRYYENNLDEVKDILNEGSKKAREKAEEILKEVRKLVKMY